MFDSAWIKDFKLLPAVRLLTPKIHLTCAIFTSSSSSSLTLSCCHVIYTVRLIPLRLPLPEKDSRPYVELEFYLICLFQKVCTYFFFLNLYGWSFLSFFFLSWSRKVLFEFILQRRSADLVVDTDTENSLSRLIINTQRSSETVFEAVITRREYKVS